MFYCCYAKNDEIDSDFWAKNPQFAALRNTLPEGENYYNDPDQLLIGSNGLSHTEAEVQMGMWALWSAPMILSVEVRDGCECTAILRTVAVLLTDCLCVAALSAGMKAILLNKEVLAISDDKLGRQATMCTDTDCLHGGVLYGGSTSIWNKTLADGSVAVGLVNAGNFGNVGKAFGDFNCSFTAKAVGLGCDDFTATDLFKGTDLGVHSGGFWREVDESSMLLLKLTCKGEDRGLL